nr:MAG TPA: hypothetical protein [Caudoviricetes sp.]
MKTILLTPPKRQTIFPRPEKSPRIVSEGFCFAD